MTVKPGDKITAEWANSLYDPMRSVVGEGIIDKDGFAACVSTGQISLRRFVLVDALTADNDSTTARILYYDAVEDEYSVGDSPVEFELYGFAGWTGSVGARGWCTLKDGRWEVVSIGVGSVRFAKLDEALEAGSSATASIWSGDTLADSGDNVEVYDWWLPTGEELASGAKIAITQISGKWYVVCAWVTKTVVVDVDIYEGKLRKKTASIIVFYSSADSAFSTGDDIFPSSDWTEKAYVTDLQVSGTTLQKKTVTGKIYNPDSNSESAWTTWHTGTECP